MTDEKSPIQSANTEQGWQELAHALQRNVLRGLKDRFIGKDEVIDLLGITLVAGENLFILGPPGTAKSALVSSLARGLHGPSFEYLLTRFTEPNELFGPFDIRRLREGELVTNTTGMLPEAALVFLDELLNANSAILNSLLMVLNERVFRRGRERWALPTLMVVGASNHLPEDEALQALFDRFLLRVRCDNVPTDKLSELLEAGWQIETESLSREGSAPGMTVEDVRRLQQVLPKIDLNPIREAYADLVRRLRAAGLSISDRRAVKLQRLVAASALICGRGQALLSDLWVLRYIWDVEEERELLEEIVGSVLARGPEDSLEHPRAQARKTVDHNALARDLDSVARALENQDAGAVERSSARDRLSALASRVEWVESSIAREQLRARCQELWQALSSAPRGALP